MEISPPFAVIEVHTSPWEAHVSRALLESEGIPAFLASEHHVGANWSMSLMLGGVRLLVRSEHTASAQSVLAMRDRGELQAALVDEFPASVWTCAHCGSTEFEERRSLSSTALSLALLLLLLLCMAVGPPAKDKTCISCGRAAREDL